MAVDTYDKLQSALADQINRDDLSVDVTAYSPATIDSAIKRFIARAENMIERDLNSRGGHKSMETVTTSLSTTGGTQTLTLPTDFLSSRTFALSLAGSTKVLTFLDTTSLFNLYPSTVSGEPEAFTIVGTNTAYLRPVPDGVYSTLLIYTAKLPRLSSTQTTNWLLTNHEDIYIHACMIHSGLYLENDERLVLMKGAYDQSINDLMGDDRMTRWNAVQNPNVQVAIQ